MKLLLENLTNFFFNKLLLLNIIILRYYLNLRKYVCSIVKIFKLIILLFLAAKNYFIAKENIFLKTVFLFY